MTSLQNKWLVLPAVRGQKSIVHEKQLTQFFENKGGIGLKFTSPLCLRLYDVLQFQPIRIIDVI